MLIPDETLRERRGKEATNTAFHLISHTLQPRIGAKRIIRRWHDLHTIRYILRDGLTTGNMDYVAKVCTRINF